MADALPADVDTGLVVCQFAVVGADGPDVDRNPDTFAMTGTVTFTPVDKVLLSTTAPRPLLALQPVTVGLDTDGNIVDATDNEGVWLVSGRWEVSYDLSDIEITPHLITVPADAGVGATPAFQLANAIDGLFDIGTPEAP